jgi:prepilin-type N-terminal cleavage/methylation domain-containing protein
VKIKLRNRKTLKGFTLVEMLVVVLIISVLVGLISAAAVKARHRAQKAAISLEIRHLAMALDNYRHQFGEYPPDFSDRTSDWGKSVILSHISRAFPRFIYPVGAATIAQKWQYVRDMIFNNSQYTVNGTTYNIDLNNMTPVMALAFWLGGMPDAQGQPRGFSKNPANPFESPSTQPSRIGPLFEFDPGRLQTYTYYPRGVVPGSGQPYVYLRAEQGQPESCREYYSADLFASPPTYTFKAGAVSGAKPYWDQRSKGWVNPTSFQILCCGLDGKFGLENVYPGGYTPVPKDPLFPSDIVANHPAIMNDVTGINEILPANPDYFSYLDDQTNFTTGTIGDDMP